MQSVPEKETMDAIAELFKGFADSTRVHILALLSRQELCVTDIAETVDVSQSAISHQLRILKQMHLIKFRREGKNILYSLADRPCEDHSANGSGTRSGVKNRGSVLNG